MRWLWIGGAVAMAAVVVVLLTTDEGSESSFTYLGEYQNEPLHWNACGDISWVLNPGEAPSAIVDDVHQAVRDVEAASDFSFEFAGETNARRPQGMRSGGDEADIHIEIVSDGDSQLLLFGEFGKTDVRFEAGRIAGAVIALDSANIDLLSVGDGPSTWRGLAIHELGHALGLGHSSSVDDLMFENWALSDGQLSEGDLAGLADLSGRSEC